MLEMCVHMSDDVCQHNTITLREERTYETEYYRDSDNLVYDRESTVISVRLIKIPECDDCGKVWDDMVELSKYLEDQRNREV